MIIKKPTNVYESELVKIIKQHYKTQKMSEGEKSIIYDLCISLPKYYRFNWQDICLDAYVDMIIHYYNKNKNEPGINVVCACLNGIFIDKRFELSGNKYSADRQLLIQDKSISNKKSGGK